MSPADEPDSSSDELDPGEPRTPMWLPLLGGVLFLVLGLIYVATRGEGQTVEELSGRNSAAAEADGSLEESEPQAENEAE